MELSLFLAKVLGLYLLIFGLAMLYNRGSITKAMNDVVAGNGTLLLLGIITLIIGILLVTTHNVWVYSWPVVITILGWLFLFKGVMRIFCPAKVRNFVKKFDKTKCYYTATSIFVALGAYLTYTGFGF